MAKDPDEIVVGANGTVYAAPLATTAPTTAVAAPAAGWVDLGYCTEDGVTPTDEKSMESVPAWQSFYPVRRMITDRNFSVQFTLLQWNPDTVGLAFGGATVSEPTTGVFKLSPPDESVIDERALMVDWADNAKHYRLIIPRGIVSENTEFNVRRGQASPLAVTFSVLGQDGVDPWYLLTDDPAFDISP